MQLPITHRKRSGVSQKQERIEVHASPYYYIEIFNGFEHAE